MKRIPVAGPSIGDLEIKYVTEAAETDWYEGAGSFNRRFEDAFCEYLGVRYAISLPSCTSGLHLALAALDIGPGDEVIVPDITWIASAAPITYVGAETVFADIDEGTWCLSPASFEACISERTKAVIPVDLYGNMPDLAAIRAIADRHGIAVIEDAAEAIGSMLNGAKAGSFGDLGVFSFHGSKTMTTGEGGMVVTDDKALRDRMMVLRDHGRAPGDVAFFNSEVAFKYKMSGVQAALGLAQLERIDELVAGKRMIFRLYADRLEDIPGVCLNPERPGEKNSYWMTTVLWDDRFTATKADVIASMAGRGIDARPFFHPLSSIPAYAQITDGARAQRANRVAYGLSSRGVNLPSGLNLVERDIDRIASAFTDILRGFAAPKKAAV
ncbi:MAG: DegT/DnrJ/EryC1/StrS family aminotransferase [Alphaproteobacteria bacterium]|nr:DegT/DnrJ/EryC1/StrS family aminotransferase [Alphaproteobacteria bacterium]